MHSRVSFIWISMPINSVEEVGTIYHDLNPTSSHCTFPSISLNNIQMAYAKYQNLANQQWWRSQKPNWALLQFLGLGTEMKEFASLIEQRPFFKGI
jgi:hypothetical protein